MRLRATAVLLATASLCVLTSGAFAQSACDASEPVRLLPWYADDWSGPARCSCGELTGEVYARATHPDDSSAPISVEIYGTSEVAPAEIHIEIYGSVNSEAPDFHELGSVGTEDEQTSGPYYLFNRWHPALPDGFDAGPYALSFRAVCAL
jgi:hypothetical protein